MKKVFKNVKYSNPIRLLLFALSIIPLLILIVKLINNYVISGISSFILSLILTGVYVFFSLKNIIKKKDFSIYPDRFEYDIYKIYFNSIKSYKIHWMKGAGLKIKFKSGRILRISANSNLFEDAPFVAFCSALDIKLSKFDNIKRKKSFYETKYGYYLAVIITIIVVGIFIYEFFTGFKIKTSQLVMLLIGLSAIWSGVMYKRNK